MKRVLLHTGQLQSRAAAFVAASVSMAFLLSTTVNSKAEDTLRSDKPSAADKTASTTQRVSPDAASFLRDVRPIFMGKCARCHNGETKFMYNWLEYKTAFSDRKEIKRRVWDSWKGAYYKQPMPAGNSPECQAITDAERLLIKEWVEAGGALGTPANDQNPKSKGERIESGKRIFAMVCSACHQPTGQGVPNQFPPLVQSDFLNADKARAIKILLHGRQGEIVVNGQKFNNSMPSFPFSDEEIASALTFVYNSFGNSGKEVTSSEVKTLRANPETEEQKEVVTAPPREPSPFE